MRNSHGLQTAPFPPRGLATTKTRVLPGVVTFVNVTSTSRTGNTCTFAPAGVDTPLADPSSGGSGTPNGLIGEGAPTVPGVTIIVTPSLSGQSRSRDRETKL